MDKIEFETCELCLLGKMTKKPFPREKRAIKLLDVIHSDIYEQQEVKTHWGKEYFIMFINDYSIFGYVSMIAQKSGGISIFD